MSADIDVDGGKTTFVTTQMRAQAADIAGELTSLLGKVQAVLTPFGGLWMDKATPVMLGAFVEFETMLQKAVDVLTKFAGNFDGTVKALDEINDALSKPPAPAAAPPPAAGPPPAHSPGSPPPTGHNPA